MYKPMAIMGRKWLWIATFLEDTNYKIVNFEIM